MPDSTTATEPKAMPQPRDPHLREMANCIRALAMDAVEKAKSGHPGMPMGMADIATVLFTEFLQFDAEDPHWLDRDRFLICPNGYSHSLIARRSRMAPQSCLAGKGLLTRTSSSWRRFISK